MRRKDREMSPEFAWNIVDQCEYAFLSMTTAEQTPYGIPVTIVRKDSSIYFHSAKEGHKVDCMRQNPYVCLACVGDTQVREDQFTTLFESAVVFGPVTEVLDEEEKIEALRLICQRHTPGNMALFDRAIEKGLSRTAVFKINAVEITGKCNR